MNAEKCLSPEQLYRVCDPAQFAFDTTAELEEALEVVGQERALNAIHFGIGIRREGYNLFALGPSGTGKRSVTQQFTEQKAAAEPVPDDWCYINNFKDPQKPLALALPPGMGPQLRQHMEQLVDELRSAVPTAYESDEYRARRQEIEEKLKEQQEQAFEALQKEAEEHEITMLRTPSGLAFVPTRDGEVIQPDEYEKLPEEKRKQVEAIVENLQEHLQGILQQVVRWRRESQEALKQLNREITMSAVGHVIDELRRVYEGLPAVQDYLNAVQLDVTDNADAFRRQEQPEIMIPGVPEQRPSSREAALHRYKVNVIVDRSETEGAPVIYMDNPTYQNLIGRLEHHARMGALVTDFTLIKPGVLHQANGGYLILDVREVLLQPFLWEALKRCLRSREIRIESLGHALSLLSVATLEPEPIPLDIKVVLLGERLLYYLLCELDPEFSELFKVAADFNSVMDRDEQSSQGYAHLIAMLAQREKLRPLDRHAVARVIEHGSRLAEDTDKLSTRFGKIGDLLREADYWAGEAASDVIGINHVQQAIDAWVHRNDRVQQHLLEEIQRGTLMIDSHGAVAGQVNGLSVVMLGDYAFGHPSRITAKVRQGKGEVLDIEREIELGGPIHSKGVLILTGFLNGRYAQEESLSLNASLVFEQTYGGVEGDSASSAELYALLSALADVPIAQSLAVTGSVNQNGQVQAIGGVNEKIEGFFDVCVRRGLTGEQGVLIPASNVNHLMLRRDVIDAVAENKFHIHPVETIDEGMALLTGLAAGERDEAGMYPAGSVNQRVEARLIAMARRAHEHESENED